LIVKHRVSVAAVIAGNHGYVSVTASATSHPKAKTIIPSRSMHRMLPSSVSERTKTEHQSFGKLKNS